MQLLIRLQQMLSQSARKKNDMNMDLLKAVQSQPLKKIKELVSAKGIPVDPMFIDYAALNFSLEHGRKDVAKYLLEKGCRVNKVSRLLTKPSSTPLHQAVKLGDAELVLALLEQNASMTAVNSQGNSALHLAFILREEKITDLLLDFILQTATYANPKNNNGLTHLHIACARKNASLVLSYMKIASNLNDVVNEDSPYFAGYSLTQFAVEFKSPLILKLLLEHSSSSLTQQDQLVLAQDLQDVSLMAYLMSSYARTKPQSRISQFHLACMQNDPSLVSTFLDYGALVNNPISEDSPFCPLYTPLHYAVETNCADSVRLLLQHGADVDFPNAHHMTSLHLAMYNDQPEIIELLYTAMKNKQLERVDRNGLSYFHVAVARNELRVTHKFLDDNQDPNARVFPNYRNFSGYTPLHFAVRYGHFSMAKLLIDRGANVNANDMAQHGTPLHMAVAAGHCGFVELFLKKTQARADVRRPSDHKSLLHLLVEAYMDAGGINKKLLEYVEIMVEQFELDIDARDNEGYTPLHYACAKISVGADCARLLLEQGADINIENNMKDTPFEVSFYDVYRQNAEDYMLLYEHVKGLNALGLWVNPKNEECCEKLMKEKDECQADAQCFRIMSLVKRQQDNINEILKMKMTMISKNCSVYQFALMDDNQLRQFQDFNALKTLLNGKEFVHYAYRLKMQWRKSFRLTKINGAGI